MVWIFFMFTPIWGRFPIWRAYLSNGLVQPPTRNSFWNFHPHCRGQIHPILTCSFFFSSLGWWSQAPAATIRKPKFADAPVLRIHADPTLSDHPSNFALEVRWNQCEVIRTAWGFWHPFCSWTEMVSYNHFYMYVYIYIYFILYLIFILIYCNYK